MATSAADNRLTQQQRDAVFRRDASVVLSSGAGCGKTTVLTRRYLSHLEEDAAEVSQIVAITFTERAARSMRDRIRKAVLAHLDRVEAPEDVRRWEDHLRGLETAQISTIHAFCGNLLRQHAVEAGLDPRFDILQDYLAANLQREALTACLQGLLTADSAPARDLRELILLYGWKPTVELVGRLTTEEDAPLRQRWLRHSAAEIGREWLAYARGELLPRYVTYLAAAFPKIARMFWLLRTTPCVGPKMRANVALLLDRLPRLGTANDLAGSIKELTEAAKVGTERAKAWPSEEVYEVIKEAFEHFRRELPGRLELFTREPEGLEVEIEIGQRCARVAEEAVRAYRQLKRRSGVLDFQDLLVRARDLLRDHADVRERLQRRFRFLLIDELQDTDPVQMELIEHLAGAGLTEGKLFAVGDHSQSIYRFRRADVRLFQALKQRVPHAGRLGLTENFRSQPAILDFTNILVGPGTAAACANALEDYQPLQPHHVQRNPGPCVEFLWAPREDTDLATEARIREADWIARRIADMVGAKEALIVERADRKEEHLRPVRLGDVVLLFRAMSNVELYESALRKYGLDYYLVGGRAFFAQQEIYDLLNLLRALENPQDAASLAGTLRSPFCCLSDEALFVLTRPREGPWAALHDDTTCARLAPDQRPRAAQARRFLDRWHALKDRLPIARLLGEVFADSGYDAATQFEFLGDRKLANLWKLVDMARDFDRSGLFGLAEFIARLGELVRTQPREEQAATQPENADVVRLMTIHQAKGLEFPVVVIPDLSAAGGGATNPMAVWDPRLGCVARPPAEDPPPFTDFGWRVWEAGETVEDWREDLRTLYVACTRAQDYLILSAALLPNYSPQSTWMLALAERFDLRSGRCLDEGIPADKRPQVRVTDLLTPPPEDPPLPARPERAGRRPAEDYDRLLCERAPGSLGPQACVLQIAEVECLVEGNAPFTQPLGWDAEDGSDRACWELPRERVERFADPRLALRDRVIREVLGAWDFREPEGWGPLLTHMSAALPDAEAMAALRPEVEEIFRRFVRSSVFRLLSKAAVCQRDLEYLVALPGVAGPPAVLVRGLLDSLWQDEAGAWHLLLYDTTGAGKRWETRLALGALAVQQQTGELPKTARCYRCDAGQAVSFRVSPGQVGKVVAAVAEALAPQPLSIDRGPQGS